MKSRRCRRRRKKKEEKKKKKKRKRVVISFVNAALTISVDFFLSRESNCKGQCGRSVNWSVWSCYRLVGWLVNFVVYLAIDLSVGQTIAWSLCPLVALSIGRALGWSAVQTLQSALCSWVFQLVGPLSFWVFFSALFRVIHD